MIFFYTRECESRRILWPIFPLTQSQTPYLDCEWLFVGRRGGYRRIIRNPLSFSNHRRRSGVPSRGTRGNIERVRRYTLNQRHGNEYWINPLLERLDLVRENEDQLPGRLLETNRGLRAWWSASEENSSLQVNRAAGYRILGMVDFLPPQKNILRVSFERGQVKHNLEVVIRASGIFLMFSTTRRNATGWRRYFSTYTVRKNNSTLVWEQIIHPGEISEQNIQAWISYLLSGLDKKFRLDQILHASLAPGAALSESLRKASA